MTTEPDTHTQPPTLSSVLAHASGQWALAGAEAVVHVPAMAATHVLDPTATVLWQCLDGESPLHLLFADIAEAFGVPAEQVASDCLPVLATWLHAGLATDVSVSPAALAESPWLPLSAPTAGRTWRRLVDPPNT